MRLIIRLILIFLSISSLANAQKAKYLFKGEVYEYGIGDAFLYFNSIYVGDTSYVATIHIDSVVAKFVGEDEVTYEFMHRRLWVDQWGLDTANLIEYHKDTTWYYQRSYKNLQETVIGPVDTSYFDEELGIQIREYDTLFVDGNNRINNQIRKEGIGYRWIVGYQDSAGVSLSEWYNAHVGEGGGAQRILMFVQRNDEAGGIPYRFIRKQPLSTEIFNNRVLRYENGRPFWMLPKGENYAVYSLDGKLIEEGMGEGQQWLTIKSKIPGGIYMLTSTSGNRFSRKLIIR